MNDPRLPYKDDDVPNMKSVNLVELMAWLGTDPRRWAAAAAQHWEDGSSDLSDSLEGWFAAAIDVGRRSF